MPISKKPMEQRQKAKARIAQIKNAPKRINNSLSDQLKYNDYDTNESQDS